MEFSTIVHKSTTFIKTKTNMIRVKLVGLKTFLLNQRIVITILKPAKSVLNRQKKALSFVLLASLLITLGTVILINIQIDDLRQEMMGRGISIIERFPGDEAANWLARGLSEREDWQIESLFKLKTIILRVVENRSASYALIVDEKNNKIKAHTIENLVGNQYT